MASPPLNTPAPPPTFAVGDRVQVLSAPESGGVYALMVGRLGQVTAVHDFRLHRLQIEDLLFDVQVPGMVPMPFSADELRAVPALLPSCSPTPRLLDCSVCGGAGVMSAHLPGPAEVRESAEPVLCPVCGGRGGALDTLDSSSASPCRQAGQ